MGMGSLILDALVIALDAITDGADAVVEFFGNVVENGVISNRGRQEDRRIYGKRRG